MDNIILKKMKYILTILITLFAVQAIAQPTPTYTGSYTQMSYNRGSVGALRLQYIPRGFYPFPTFDTLGTIWVDSAQTRGLFYHNGTVRLRLASVPYVDSIAASIEAGSVDSSIYSTVTRLSDSLHSLRDYVDSNNTIIYGNIATLQSDVVTLDSAVGVAFGAISDLYDTKADKDTLTNFLLKSDTATLSNRINLKQNYSDTTTWDATRYWVSTQIPSLAGYVPYTGATGNVDLGTHTISAYNGVINHVSGSGTALSVTKGGSGEALTVTKTSGSGNAMSVSGGVTQLSELHTTTKIADAYIASAATWNAKYGTSDTGRAVSNIVTGGALNKVRDSLAAIIATKGSGTVTSVATGFGVTGGTITNSGTIVVDSPTVATRARVQKAVDSLNALIAVKGSGTVTSIQLVGGTNVTITPTTAITTSGTYTISATGGSSTIVKANEFNMLYKANGDTTIRGTTKVRVDTTDSRMEFAFDTTTSTVTTDPHGGVKMWGTNRMGMGAVRINDTVSIPAALQRAINAQTTSSIIPFNFSNPPNALSYTGSYLWLKVTSTTYGTPVTNAYSATIQHLNYPKAQFATGALANATAAIRTGNADGASGLICGNTKFSGGGGRGTFTFAFPTYASTQRIMIGYSERIDGLTGDPSAFLTGYSNLMIIKDATDSTLFFSHNSGAATTTKVNTGIKPNNEDVYRLTVYIAPNSTFYAQLEVMSKTAAPTVVTINPITNVPPVGDKLVQQQAVNNGTVGGIIVYGFIQHMEEVY
jgi:hypothetical protein